MRRLVVLLILLLAPACNLSPPITIGQKDSLLGQGHVLTITNTSDAHLHDVTVTIRSPDGEVKTFSTPTLDPHETISVGWLKLDGWPIPDGARVTVTCKDYQTSAGPYTVRP